MDEKELGNEAFKKRLQEKTELEMDKKRTDIEQEYLMKNCIDSGYTCGKCKGKKITMKPM